MTGDIIDAIADIKSCGLDTLSYGLSQIAPTYAVTGNHEFNNGNLDTWKNILKQSNINVIDNSIKIYEKNNEFIAIIGLEDDVTYNPNIFNEIKTLNNMPIILLAHRPELLESYFLDSFSITPNLVFSGHSHGGQFRIPFLNKGIIAPGQGILPRYTSGLYKFNDGKLIISRGLGNSIIPIRINNRPHIPIITLK
jgi:predicted MPP superfamily phosphohydrolase